MAEPFDDEFDEHGRRRPRLDSDGRGKHPGDGDPIEVMVSGFEATIESRDAEITLLRRLLGEADKVIVWESDAPSLGRDFQARVESALAE